MSCRLEKLALLGMPSQRDVQVQLLVQEVRLIGSRNSVAAATLQLQMHTQVVRTLPRCLFCNLLCSLCCSPMWIRCAARKSRSSTRLAAESNAAAAGAAFLHAVGNAADELARLGA